MILIHKDEFIINKAGLLEQLVCKNCEVRNKNLKCTLDGLNITELQQFKNVHEDVQLNFTCKVTV